MRSRLRLRRAAVLLVLTLSFSPSGRLAVWPSSAQAQEGSPPRPSHIHSGDCDELGPVVQPLTFLTVPEGEVLGNSDAVVAEAAFTNIPQPLSELVAADHALKVHLSREKIQIYLACGDIGGTVDLQAGDTVQFQAQGATGSALKLSGSATAQCDTCTFDSLGSAAIDISGTQPGTFKLALSNSGITSASSDGVNVNANGFAIILIRCVFTIATGAKNAILLTSPATAVTYANSQNIAAPGTSTTKSVGVNPVPYTAL